MFDSEFYPTPKKLAWDLVKNLFSGLESDRKYKVLDPSAGKGDLLDMVKEYTERKYRCECYAIEPIPDCQAILYSKKYKLIDSDFLRFHSLKSFDLIIMNPPFSKGADHFLKAWDTLKSGRIACVLNAETIKNPFSKNRQLIQHLIEKHGGRVEFAEFAFSAAERKSDVEIAIIYINKEAEDDEDVFKFKGSRVNDDLTFDAAMINNKIARHDFIENAVIAFENSVACIKEMKIKYAEFSFYFNVIGKRSVEKDALEHIARGLADYEEIIDEINKAAWDNIFHKSNISQFLTSKVRSDFHTQTENLGHLNFTRENIEQVIESLFLSRHQIMKQCIVESFELLTKHHKENREVIEGWLTNGAYNVNRRFIYPRLLTYKNHGDWVNCTYEYRSVEVLEDLEKALKNISSISMIKREDSIGELLRHKIYNKEFGQWHDSTFLKFKFFKKGTGHFEFKDKFIWTKFNEIAVDGKTWLPEEVRNARHRFHDEVA